MDAASAHLAGRIRSTRGRPHVQETPLNEPRPEALVVIGQGDVAHLQVRTVLPWTEVLQILRLLMDAQVGIDRNSAPP